MCSRIQHQYEGAILTPALWKGDAIAGLEQIELDFTNIPPFKGQINPNLVLGKRAETFIEHVLKHAPRYNLIASNIQLQDQKKTIGELDYILFDNKDNTYIHLELVSKFYVYIDNGTDKEIQHWVGPNRKDNFEDKLKKLNSKQLPILYHPITRATLEKINIDVNIVKQKVYYQGQLFIPYGPQKKYKTVNNDCIYGYYFKAYELTKKAFGNYLFYLPEKQDWYSDPSQHNIWEDFDTIRIKIGTALGSKKSPLVWMKTDNAIEKFIVVWW